VVPGGLVGVCAERSIEMLIAVLGILKAGGAYVPLDPAFPRDRLTFMAQDAGLRLVVTKGDVDGLLSEMACAIVRLEVRSVVGRLVGSLSASNLEEIGAELGAPADVGRRVERGDFAAVDGHPDTADLLARIPVARLIERDTLAELRRPERVETAFQLAPADTRHLISCQVVV